jgi:hypothetical protein
MKRLLINVLLMFFTLGLGILVSAVRLGSVQRPSFDRGAEEYAVYSGLINTFPSEKGVDLLLVANQTISTVPQEPEVDEKGFIKHNLPNETVKETLDDYKLNDHQPLKIVNRLTVNRKYILLSNREAKSYFENSSAFLSFQEKYPNSSGRIIMLSRVGFNKKMDEALVYAWAYCGGDCGGGGYYLLRKADGVWKVKEKKIWIS